MTPLHGQSTVNGAAGTREAAVGSDKTEWRSLEFTDLAPVERRNGGRWDALSLRNLLWITAAVCVVVGLAVIAHIYADAREAAGPSTGWPWTHPTSFEK